MPDVTGGRGSFGGARSSSGGAGRGTAGGSKNDKTRSSTRSFSSAVGQALGAAAAGGPMGAATAGIGGGVSAGAARGAGANVGAGKGTAGGTGKPYTPGAVGNYPDANAAAVVDTLLGAVPGYGATDTLYKGGKLLSGDADLNGPVSGMFGDMFGAEYGEQAGWSPDRYRGQDSLTGIGGSGGAVNSADDERVIAGQSYGAGTQALTGDSDTDTGAGTGALYSDVMLQDRRKPRTDNMGAGSRMALALA